jgi:cytosine/adenosine deaminase-related metal-dependent hydrolase
VLCYEATERNGREGALLGLRENARFAGKCHARRGGHFAAMAGAHASFTLDDASLSALKQLADQLGIGVHIHVAEDPCDEQITLEKYGAPLVGRLARLGLLGPQHVLGHCIHLNEEGIETVNESGVTVAHNARSNMNNAVGYAPIAKLTCPVMLGTDGIGADLLAEAQAAWFKSRDGSAGISPVQVIEMLAASARRASQSLGVTLGKLQAGAVGDVVVTDYVPFTELTADNFPAHFIFAMGSHHVKHVIARGKVALRDRVVQTCDEAEVRRRSVAIASAMWKRMESIPC